MAALNLAGRVALITGAGSGIGRATALQFAINGCRLCLVDINATTLKDTADLCRKHGSNDKDIATDVRDLTIESNLKEVTTNALATFGKVNILVNNAGMMHPGDSAIHRVSSEALDYTHKLLLKAPVLLTKYLVPSLRQNDGCVINIASVAGITSAPGALAYTAGKAALIAVTRASAKELAPLVRVNSISPGLIDTNIFNVMADENRRKVSIQKKLDITALHRFGQPEEIGRAAVYLAKETFVTGTNLLVDGGFTLPLYNETVVPHGSKV